MEILLEPRRAMQSWQSPELSQSDKKEKCECSARSHDGSPHGDARGTGRTPVRSARKTLKLSGRSRLEFNVCAFPLPLSKKICLRRIAGVNTTRIQEQRFVASALTSCRGHQKFSHGERHRRWKNTAKKPTHRVYMKMMLCTR